MIEIERLVPPDLHDEYLDNSYVHAVFNMAQYRGMTREQALVACVKYLCQDNNRLFKEATTTFSQNLQPIIFKKEE